jgi:hypothetical protein
VIGSVSTTILPSRLCTVDDFRTLCEAAQAVVAKKFCLWRTTSLMLSSPTCEGRTRGGGLSTKISLAVDALGNLVHFVLTAGQLADICQAEGLISSFSFANLLADKGYDSERLRSPRRARSGRHSIETVRATLAVIYLWKTSR